MVEFRYAAAEFLPFRDKEVYERVRRIKKEDICKHPNRNFNIRVIEDTQAFEFMYILDIVGGIKQGLDEGRPHVIILPAPNPNYAYAAEMINQLRIPCHHVYTFNMDEYADESGNTAPCEWKGGFQY